MNDIELFESYFQESKSYYLEKLKLFENNKKITFNISVFLFGFFWFLYRKLYWEAAIIFIILFLQTIIEKKSLFNLIDVDKTQFYGLIFNILFLILLSFIGNYIYLKKAITEVKKVKANHVNVGEQNKILTKKGGTNIIVPIILLIIIILVTALS